MARRYAILQKKVRELESNLGNLLHCQSANQPYEDDDFCKAIDSKFAFARRLLSAEMLAQRPLKQPLHLHHIQQRLAALEAAFLNWVHPQTWPSDGNDAFSECSCSCINEEEEMSDEKNQETVTWEDFMENRVERDEEEDPETFSCNEFEERAPEAVQLPAQEDVTVAEGERRDEKRIWTWKRGLVSGLLFAVVMGVVTAAVTLSHHHVENAFLVPT